MKTRWFSALALSILTVTLAPHRASAESSPDSIWSTQATVAARAARADAPATPAVYRLNRDALRQLIAGAPAEGAVRSW